MELRPNAVNLGASVCVVGGEVIVDRWHNLLIVHPNQAHALRTAYGDQLDAMLKSADVVWSCFSNTRMTATGAAYVCAGAVGTVGFEAPLTLDTWEDKAIRSPSIECWPIRSG